MRRSPRIAPILLLSLAAVTVLPPSASAEFASFRGKVVMEDGSPPGRLVGIQRTCEGLTPVREANASAKTGEYFVRLFVSDFGTVFTAGFHNAEMLVCHLEAVAPGYTSTRIDLSDRRFTRNPLLPNLVLTRQIPGALVDLQSAPVPRPARKPWERALKYLAARDWAGAETDLRAVVAAAPGFAPAWSALGVACQNQQKRPEARAALERAVQLDPKRLPLYLALASVQIDLQDWPAAVKTSESLIQADTAHTYLEAYLDNAKARFQQKDIDGALKRMNELIRIDKHHDLPRAEYILGIILEAKGELDAAAAHMRNYLREHPRAKDAAAVADRLANLGKHAPADLAAEVVSADLRLAAPGEAPVPGGIQAFSAIARIPGAPTYQDFFLQYCRALTSGSATVASPTAEVGPAIRTFVSTMAEFERLGERSGDRLTVRLALDTKEHREKTARALALLGWRLRQSGQDYDIEPGDQPVDGLRQRIPAAFGIDELEMRSAIAARRPFQFEIPIESARLVGGPAWSATLKGLPEAAYGPVEIFLNDRRFARVYAGLAAMEGETASAVVSAVGLIPLITRYAALLADYGGVLALSGDHVVVPGGVEAGASWAALAGAGPKDSTSFFRALIEKDNGLLMTFFFDLSRADTAHQRFFTATPARAQAFYQWYRNSAGPGPPPPGDARWQAAILQNLRLGADGSVEFPGGRRAWTTAGGTGDAALLSLPTLEPLAALTRLEDRRGRLLDQDSAALLARHYQEWRHLFAYFEKLPGLALPQFQALAAFADDAAAQPPAQRARLVGVWHSLVELIVLASEAGSLNVTQAAGAFGNTCQVLRAPNPSMNAIEMLRALAGSPPDLDEGVAGGLLRLSGAKRDAFERVRELQGVPRLASLGKIPDPAKTLAALSGVVYAALLDPDWLLVAEDPQLLSKHDFLPGADKRGELFAASGLVVSSIPPGSHLTGGFAGFNEVVRVLDRRTAGPTVSTESADDPPAPDKAVGPGPAPDQPLAAPPTGTVFRAAGRIVEVYATVTDRRGRYVDDLQRGEFGIQVEGLPTGLFAFENHTSSVSVAMLFDTTGSMSATLPSLKSAAMRLVDELRPGDSAAVYGFNDRVTEFQPFTTDKAAVKRGVLRAHAAGTTALFDALVRVSRDLDRRRGKKVIIVFTDGDDNASMLTADAAILRAKSRGIPIYTIAEGEALLHPRLVGQLESLSQFTGGTPFLIRKLEDIGAVFQKMSEDLMHGYLLAFQPPPDNGNAWHKIAVTVTSRKGLVLRAREAYFSD